MPNTPRIIVVGGGLAGLAAVITRPALTNAAPGTTNPTQPGETK